MNIIDKNEYQTILNLYNEGCPRSVIAKKYGVSRSQIDTILKRCGVEDIIKPTKKIPETEHQKIIDMYLNGSSQSEIGKLYGVSRVSISNIIHSYKIEHRNPSSKSQFSKEDLQYMCQLYDDGMTCKQVADTLGVSESLINYWFKKLNKKTRSNTINSRKYTLDEHYFDIIDTQDKAYILGFLYSDGCNFTDANRIILCLQDQDKHILDSIKECVGTNAPLYFNKLNEKNAKHKNTYSLTMRSKHMSKVLSDMGMVKAKSLILKFPTNISKEMLPHFIRGFFDGDGVFPTDKTNYTLGILGTEDFCIVLQSILKENGIESDIKNVNDPSNSTRQLYIRRKENSKKFLEYIYKDANLYLFRKHDLYLKKYVNNPLVA